jgi:hypothetical protein
MVAEHTWVGSITVNADECIPGEPPAPPIDAD